MSKIYITSDLHFNHNKDFLYESRGFSNIEDMNNTIIANWNSIIAPDDDIYILGDLMLGGSEKMADGLNLIISLNGKLHLIRGNHDTDTRWKAYGTLHNVVEQKNAIYLKYNKYHFYLSHYPSITSNFDSDKPLKARLLNLCGHTHTKDKWQDIGKGYIYHCELDAHNCYPVLLDDIIEDFKRTIINLNG